MSAVLRGLAPTVFRSAIEDKPRWKSQITGLLENCNNACIPRAVIHSCVPPSVTHYEGHTPLGKQARVITLVQLELALGSLHVTAYENLRRIGPTLPRPIKA